MNRRIGTVKKEILKIFDIDSTIDLPIMIGERNLEHIKNEHKSDYEKYGDKIFEILENPTYVAKHPEKTSIEYVKEYLNEKKELILVAVRITRNETAFVKTMFVMSEEKKRKYIKRRLSKKSD